MAGRDPSRAGADMPTIFVASMPSFWIARPPRLVPVEGGRWMFMDPGGSALLNDRDFPTPEVARSALAEALMEGRRHGGP